MPSAVPSFPRAILFDLDDTLLRAYANPEAVWVAVSEELAAHLAPFAPSTVALAIQTQAREFWADPERHRYWRQRLYESRREIVRRALPALSRRDRGARRRPLQRAPRRGDATLPETPSRRSTRCDAEACCSAW